MSKLQKENDEMSITDNVLTITAIVGFFSFWAVALLMIWLDEIEFLKKCLLTSFVLMIFSFITIGIRYEIDKHKNNQQIK